MPRLPLILAIIAALLIAGGRLGKRRPVAIAGFVMLALAGLLVLLGWGLRRADTARHGAIANGVSALAPLCGRRSLLRALRTDSRRA